MTELPSRPSPTRSQHGTTPPLEPRATPQTRSPYQTPSPFAEPVVEANTSASRPPIAHPPELSLRPRRHVLPTAGYLVLGGALITAGWMLLPHGGGSHLRVREEKKSYLQEPNRSAAHAEDSDASPLPALPNAATTPPRDLASDQREPGLRHITTLQLSGAYQQAAEYAVAAPLEYRRDFTIAAYHEWGRYQPEQAIASAIRIEEPFTRDFAMHSVLSGWARNDPEGLAETALAFPDSDFKKAALTRALRAWMNKDPNLAGDWIMTHPDVVPIAEEMFRKDRR